MDWQQLAAIGAVGLAVLYLVRRMVHALRDGKSQCPGCSGCPTDEETGRAPVRRQLYSLGAPAERKP